MKKLLPVLGLLIAGNVSATSLFYQLTQDGCTGGCGTAPFGTVELDQTDALHVLVTATLNSGNFYADNGSHTAFVFDVNGTAVTIANFTTEVSAKNSEFSFVVAPPPIGDPPFGSFPYGIAKPTNSNDHCCQILTFTVTRVANTALSVTDFVANTDGYFFAADMFSTQTGNTGAVASNTPCTDCDGGGTPQSISPEPWSFILTATGLLALFASRKYRSQTR